MVLRVLPGMQLLRLSSARHKLIRGELAQKLNSGKNQAEPCCGLETRGAPAKVATCPLGARPKPIGALFGCFARKMDGPGVPGD